ncbi:MAG: hypothetical protein DLM59_03935 [Pseudonocardiales bacterium]|nr:MAG: hypothetical protein DLM59_03935 [Pseudonocardiales bacterium]
MLTLTVAALRRGALAVCVLDDVDLVPVPDGLLLTGAVQVRVPWDECRQALRGADPECPEGRRLLTAWLRMRRLLADADSAAVAAGVRPLGLPVGHVLHPGPGWGATVMGGALDLGLGFIGLDQARAEEVTAIAPGVWTAEGTDVTTYRSGATAYLTAMAHLAAERRMRSLTDPLRPMGDCDVVTLLCHRDFRTALAGPVGGMVAVGVPMRDRGWTELRRVDPAFIVTAAAATDAHRRGFDRPLLITTDEVVMVAPGGRPGQNSLADAVSDEPWRRPVLYH